MGPGSSWVVGPIVVLQSKCALHPNVPGVLVFFGHSVPRVLIFLGPRDSDSLSDMI